jgi:mRNA-degrading endonuclease toxin of MazEF toxin-antitoxin module
MNGKQRREYWMKVERLRAQLDAKYFNATKDSILKQFKRFAKDIEIYGIDAARTRLGLDLWEKELIKVFEDLYKEAAVLFGNATYRALKIEANRKAETFGFNREWTAALLDFLMKQGFVLVADITKTTKDKLLAIVTKGVEDGLGVDEIVKLILSDEQLAYAAFRARRIVRTEVMRASNMAAMKGAEAHGFEVDKIWISARDSKTRRIPEDEFDHWEMDGVVVPFKEPFTSTGKKGEPVVAMQPGDLSAPAGFTINCRCTVGFIPKRDANGNLIMKPKTGGVNLQTPTNYQNVVNQQIEKPKTLTKEDIEKNISSIFTNNSNLNVRRVTTSPNMTIDDLKKRQDTLEKLTTEYKISEAIDNQFGTIISFESNKRSYGYISSSRYDGKVIYEANFGDRYDISRAKPIDPNKRYFFRGKSRVDEKNLDQATTVHEFAHLMALDSQTKPSNAPTELVKYFKELRKLRTAYRKELNLYYENNDVNALNDFSLGDYANTNINEFMAEAFTEYKLKTNPSKYAVLVGQLMDKYFKK